MKTKIIITNERGQICDFIHDGDIQEEEIKNSIKGGHIIYIKEEENLKTIGIYVFDLR